MVGDVAVRPALALAGDRAYTGGICTPCLCICVQAAKGVAVPELLLVDIVVRRAIQP
jgi:hypothetical protein